MVNNEGIIKDLSNEGGIFTDFPFSLMMLAFDFG